MTQENLNYSREKENLNLPLVREFTSCSSIYHLNFELVFYILFSILVAIFFFFNTSILVIKVQKENIQISIE